MPNCLERHFLCKEVNWGLPTQHLQKDFVRVSIKKYQKKINMLHVPTSVYQKHAELVPHVPSPYTL